MTTTPTNDINKSEGVPVTKYWDSQHAHQKRVFHAFDQGEKRFFVLNWHRRARKTTLLLNLLIRECCRNLDVTFDYVGPTYRQAKNIIWRDPNMLNAYLPPKDEIQWTKNESELYVKFETGSILNIRGADSPDSLRGTNAKGVGFDEYALMNSMVWYEVYRPIIAQDSSRWAAFLFTPKGQNHAFEFITRAETDPDSYVSTLPASESGIIPQDELEKARNEMPPELFMQEFMCSFVAEEECTFITSASLEALRDKPYVEDKPRTFIAVDPATGGDECVAKVFRNVEEVDMAIYHHRDEMKIVAELTILARRHNTKNFVIESIGIGGGIASRLREMGLNVFDFEPAGKATDSDHFANKKAEIWWEVGRMVRDGKAVYPEDLKTRQQLSSVKYKIQSSSGKLICEPKDLTKKRIGCSPDRADAWVIGIYHWQDFYPDGHRVTDSSVPSYTSLGVG